VQARGGDRLMRSRLRPPGFDVHGETV